MSPIERVKQRTQNDECVLLLSRTLGFRWYLNRIENLMLSIFIEHPDPADPFRIVGDQEVYDMVFRSLRQCELNMIEIKKMFKPPKPEGVDAHKQCGCWNDDDCGGKWWCGEDSLCHPPPRPDEVASSLESLRSS